MVLRSLWLPRSRSYCRWESLLCSWRFESQFTEYRPGEVISHNHLSYWSLYKIRAIDRKQEVPHDGAMCDLLWSDPDGTHARKIASPPIISHTPKIFLDGVSLLAVLGFCLALTSQKASHTTMLSTSSPEHINLPWMDSSLCLIKQLSQFGVLLIIATGELLLSIRFHH